MKLIIAGSRDMEISTECIVQLAIQFGLVMGPGWPYEIVSGACPTGPDSKCEEISEYTEGSLTEFPADWDKHGKAAGPIRNKEMAEYADALLLIWNGESRGSASMKREMIKLNKPVFEVILRKIV